MLARGLLALLLVTPALVAQDLVKPNPAEAALVEALHGDKAFAKGDGGKVARGAWVKFFEANYADQIKLAFNEEAAEIEAFLAANIDIKEMLYAAIDPETDNVVHALEVFRDLYKLGPEKVKAYPNVAVAVAVTWDNPKGVYDYRGHQVRTKSELPASVAAMDHVKNFEMLARIDGPLKQAVQFFPWEFLVHVVNHRTPTDERDWALKNYLAKRSGVGKIYFDVEYDQGMLRTQSEVCKLNDKPYTLPSIKKHGGVCAMQADFAARVAKSLVVPAEYVRGESNSGGLHAWVMWVEVKAVSKDKIDFALMSEGRYLGDQYYVGTVVDPRTGSDMTDRDMERRLTFLGLAPQASRHADLLMRAYPVVREQRKLTAPQQVAYLKKVHDIFPSDEKAWLELAKLFKDGKATDEIQTTLMADRALTTFARYPDFSWRVLDDLMTPVTDKAKRTRLFEKYVASYEILARPDLACEARLKLAEYQAEAKDYKKAADGIAVTCLKFPSEGRYVPKMMTKLEEICKDYKGTSAGNGTKLLGEFYVKFLPLIPKRRGDEVSKYCVAMYEQGIAFLESNNKAVEAAGLKQQLNAIKAGRK